MNIAAAAIKNPLICIIIIAISLLGGWFAYQSMPRFEDPEFTIRQAQIFTQYPGASPKEVLDEVTEPLETALQTLPEVKTVNSISSDGLSEITVEIRYGASPTKDALGLIWTKVRNKINDAQGDLPPGAGPTIVQDDFGDVFGLYYLLTGEGYSPAELYEYAKTLRKELLLIDGVAKINIIGDQQEVIYVEIARDRAASLGLSVNEVYDTLAQQNTITAAGDFRLGADRVTVDPTGKITSVEAIEGLIIGDSNSGSLTRLGDIATVRRGYEEPVKQYIRYDGQPAIGFGISNILGANVVKIGEDVSNRLRTLESLRPVGIEVNEYYHQGKAVDVSIRSFGSSVIAALIIVFLTLFVFMGVRSGIVMGATVLVTMAATLLIMWISGIPMHRISLGALIISLGMLVDNGVVVTDGILVGVQQGRKKLDIAMEVARQNMKPLLGGTLVGIIAFAPIGFAPGDTAEFTGSLFWVVMIALALSWVFAFTLTPLFCHWAFPEQLDGADNHTKSDGRFMTTYKNVIRWVLSNKAIALSFVIFVFISALWGFQFVKVGFFPASTTPQVVVDYVLPEGTDIEQTRNDMIKLERFARQLDGVNHVQTLVGEKALRYMLIYQAGSASSSIGQLLLKTEDYRDNDRIIREIQSYADENFTDGLAKAWKFILGPGGGAKIEVEFSGPDSSVLRQLSSEAKAIMAADGAAILIQDDWKRQVPIIEPVFSANKGERVGVTRKQVAESLNENLSGVRRGIYRDGDELIPIISRAPENERANPWDMASLQILTPSSPKPIPMAQVIDDVHTVWRDGKILRKNRVLTINAQCDPALGELADDLFSRLRPQIEAISLPDGYTLKWEGEFGSSSEAQGNLASTIPLGLLAMILVVVVLFNALRQPLVIWAVVPLAIVGVTFGLVLTNTPFEFMGILGLLSLSGLLIQNSLVLVDSTDELIAEGMPRFDALVEAAANRLRPVTMGAFTTVLGVIPLYFDAFFRSMTVVIAFGLSFATLITLLVTPAIYGLLFGIKKNEVRAYVTTEKLEAVAAQ